MIKRSWTTIKVTEVDPNVSVLTMRRPDQRNAINAQMADELEACLIDLKDKQDLRALIITGEGTTFGAGADLKEGLHSPPSRRRRHARPCCDSSNCSRHSGRP